MKPEIFVDQVHSAIVKQNLTIYKDLFEATFPESADDSYWRRALELYQSLNQQERTVLLQIMRQVMVDTISNIFAILDGVSSMDGPYEEFRLTSKSDDRVMNGKLQELFLEMDEREMD